MNVLLLSPYPERLWTALDLCGDTHEHRADPIDDVFCLEHEIDFIVSYGYRHIIKPSVLKMFPLAAVNLHISMLPHSRGAHPVFWSVLNELPLGVTIHLLDNGLDTGNILFQREVRADCSKHTFASLYNVHCDEIDHLFSLNWRYIRTKECAGWAQQGLPTLHRARDLGRWVNCMPESWNTPITVFRGLAAKDSTSAY
jgi:methionyl-tRNA formyltransferase